MATQDPAKEGLAAAEWIGAAAARVTARFTNSIVWPIVTRTASAGMARYFV